MSHEHKVQQYYDNALHAYQKVMGHQWHHRDPEAASVGIDHVRCCEILEERVVALAGLREGGKALDFGSGIAGPTCHMAKVSGASFVGLTNNERLNTVARKRIADLGLSERVSITTLEDTGYKNLPFPDNTFDAATFFESVCHLPDKQAFFREVRRVLKPGGRIAGEDWIQRPFGEIQTEEQIMKHMTPVNELFSIPWHGTVESYRDMMKEAGLEVGVARDLFPGVICWSAAQNDEMPGWLGYEGAEETMFREGEKALLAARRVGVFTVGLWAARKPLG